MLIQFENIFYFFWVYDSDHVWEAKKFHQTEYRWLFFQKGKNVLTQFWHFLPVFSSTPLLANTSCRVSFGPFFVALWTNCYRTNTRNKSKTVMAQTSFSFNVKNSLTHQSWFGKKQYLKIEGRSNAMDWLIFLDDFFAVGLISEEWSVRNRLIA